MHISSAQQSWVAHGYRTGQCGARSWKHRGQKAHVTVEQSYSWTWSSQPGFLTSDCTAVLLGKFVRAADAHPMPWDWPLEVLGPHPAMCILRRLEGHTLGTTVPGRWASIELCPWFLAADRTHQALRSNRPAKDGPPRQSAAIWGEQVNTSFITIPSFLF